MALSGPATIQLLLDEFGIDFNTGRHAVDNASHRWSMTLAEGCQREDMPESVTHDSRLLRSILRLLRDFRNILRLLRGVRNRLHLLRDAHNRHSDGRR